MSLDVIGCQSSGETFPTITTLTEGGGDMTLARKIMVLNFGMGPAGLNIFCEGMQNLPAIQAGSERLTSCILMASFWHHESRDYLKHSFLFQIGSMTNGSNLKQADNRNVNDGRPRCEPIC